MGFRSGQAIRCEDGKSGARDTGDDEPVRAELRARRGALGPVHRLVLFREPTLSSPSTLVCAWWAAGNRTAASKLCLSWKMARAVSLALCCAAAASAAGGAPRPLGASVRAVGIFSKKMDCA